MKKNTKFAFNAYLQQLARLNGVEVEELSSKFTVEPSVQQTLEDEIQQSAAFLTLINISPSMSSQVSCWGWAWAALLPGPRIRPSRIVSRPIQW